MIVYKINTYLAVKPVDNSRLWISQHINDLQLEFRNLQPIAEIYNSYFNYLDNHGVTISKTARKNFKPFLIDDLYCYHYQTTGKTLFYDRSANYCKERYIDIFTTIDIYEKSQIEIA